MTEQTLRAALTTLRSDLDRSYPDRAQYDIPSTVIARLDSLLASAPADEAQAAFVQVQCTDMEDYARIFNEGFNEAQRQCEADVRSAGAAALKEAAAEHEDIADWLEERADAIPGRTLHCPVGCDDGACEICPCCSAGFCVYGLDGLPEDPEDVGRWLEIAAQHNPVAKLLAAQARRMPTDAEIHEAIDSALDSHAYDDVPIAKITVALRALLNGADS